MSHLVVFATDRGRAHQQLARSSAPSGLEVRMLRRPSEVELTGAVRDAAFIVSERNQPIPRGVIEAARELKAIVRLGSLAHDIDLDAAKARGIPVSVVPIRSSILAAEHALMMMLALLRHLGRAIRTGISPEQRAPRQTEEDVFAYNWNAYPDLDGLFHKAIFIWGMGEIGVELARRLRPFAPKLMLYHKRVRYPVTVEEQLGIRFSEVEAGLSTADVIVSALPLGSDTKNAIHDETLALMKPTALLVHVGSGGVVDEDAVHRALTTERLAGAALDTFTLEPFPADHPLALLARQPRTNLLLTPHIASASEPNDREEDYDEIMRLLAGKPLLHRIA